METPFPYWEGAWSDVSGFLAAGSWVDTWYLVESDSLLSSSLVPSSDSPKSHDRSLGLITITSAEEGHLSESGFSGNSDIKITHVAKLPLKILMPSPGAGYSFIALFRSVLLCVVV